jgi:uncharacterized repeat protein (TIGR03803 family)
MIAINIVLKWLLIVVVMLNFVNTIINLINFKKMKFSYFNSLKSLLTRDLSASKAFPSNTLFLAILSLGIFSKTAQAENYTILARFDGKNGSAPASSVILDANGNLYGTTHYGPKRLGTIFKLTPKGVITTLFNFSHDKGYAPSDGLIWGKDGNLYGVNPHGKKNFGSVYIAVCSRMRYTATSYKSV